MFRFQAHSLIWVTLCILADTTLSNDLKDAANGDSKGSKVETSPRSSEGSQNDLVLSQSRIADKYAKLENLLIRMAELEAGTNAQRSSLLMKAAQQSKERLTRTQLNSIVQLLEQKQLKRATEGQQVVHGDLKALLELLLSENRNDRIKNEQARIREYIKEVERLIRMQRGLQGRTEGDGAIPDLSVEQGKLASRAGELAAELEKNDQLNKSPDKDSAKDSEQDPGKNSENNSGKNAEKDSEKDKRQATENADSKNADNRDTPERNAVEKDSPEKDNTENSPDNNSAEKDNAAKSKERESKNSKSPSEKGLKDSPNEGDSSQDSQEKSDSPNSEKKGSESKPMPQPNDGSAPMPAQQEGEENDQQNESRPKQEDASAKKRIAAAEDRMRAAQKKLDEANRKEAAKDQEKAKEELEKAKAELEEILRQMREEEVERVLAMLEVRFRRMLETQIRVFESTKQLDETAEDKRDREFLVRSNRLSFDESRLVVEADRALQLLQEDASSLAFPESVEQVRDDMQQVTDRLSTAKTDKITQGIQEEIISALEEMVAALQKAQQDKKDQKENKEQRPNGPPQEPSLVDQIAELKMIRALQMRVNTRTQRFAKLLANQDDLVGQAVEAELIDALNQLADREKRIHELTRDIVLGKNR